MASDLQDNLGTPSVKLLAAKYEQQTEKAMRKVIKKNNDKEAVVEKISEWDQSFLTELYIKAKVEKARITEEGRLSTKLFNFYCEETEKIPEEIRRMSLTDFLEKCNYEQAQNKNEPAASISVPPKPKLRKVSKVETVKRPPKSVIPSSMQTPVGRQKIPVFITPKVKTRNELLSCRALGKEEVAFSVKGTPVVLNPEPEDEAIEEIKEEITKLLNVDANLLTPDTQQIIAGMKNILKKKGMRS